MIARMKPGKFRAALYALAIGLISPFILLICAGDAAIESARSARRRFAREWRSFRDVVDDGWNQSLGRPTKAERQWAQLHAGYIRRKPQ